MSTRELLGQLRRARSGRDAARHEVYESRLEILGLTRAQERAGRGDEQDPDTRGALDAARERLARRKGLLSERERAVSGLVGRLFERPPQDLLGEWSDETPILLLPLRVETKFKTVDRRQELWVRVFPDEIAITTHEPILTTKEHTEGMAYWEALRAATTEEARETAWRTLADMFGANRAAWVALQLKPTNWSTPPPAAGVDLAFPNVPLTKPDSWSQAPHSIVMPDRLLLMLLRGNTLVQTIPGKPIDDYVVLGPAPLDDTGTASITRTGDKRLEYGEDFAWIKDFRDAERRGLAFIVPLNADDARGFDRLLVLGVKHSADEQDGQKLVEG